MAWGTFSLAGEFPLMENSPNFPLEGKFCLKRCLGYILRDIQEPWQLKAAGPRPTIKQLEKACKGNGWHPKGNRWPRMGNRWPPSKGNGPPRKGNDAPLFNRQKTPLIWVSFSLGGKFCLKRLPWKPRPPKFKERPSKNTVKQVIFEDSPPKFGGWIVTPQIWGAWVFGVVGGKTGSICHFAFSLVWQCLRVPR